MSEIDWLAGVFSSSGSVGLYKGRPTVSLCRDDELLLCSVRDRFGFGKTFGNIKRQKRANSERRTYTSGPKEGETFYTQETYLFEWKVVDYDALAGMTVLVSSALLGRKARARANEALMIPARNKRCSWPSCNAQVPPAMWGCRDHWYTLPDMLRERIWRARPVDTQPYIIAARAAQTWIAKDGPL